MRTFNEKEKKTLLKNKFISKITTNHVTFTFEFKKMALKKYLSGFMGRKIFSDAGFSEELFKTKYVNGCFKRWKKAYLENGEKGLKESKRGRKTYSRKDVELNSEKDYLERIAYLEAENDFLKKLKALGEEE